MSLEITIILDNLRSCHNVGSIIRTANGFKINKFIFIGTTPYPVLKHDRRLKYQALKQTQQIHKTALGTELTIEGLYFKTPQEFLATRQDLDLICIEQTNTSEDLASYHLQQDTYVVFGNELEGVSDDLLKAASRHLMIPMLGDKESFNVSIACGMVLYQLHIGNNWPS